MANNYLNFSEILPNLTAEEEAWLKDQLQTVAVVAGVEYSAPTNDDPKPSGDIQW